MKRRYHVVGVFTALLVSAAFIAYVARVLHGRDLSVFATPRALLGISLAALFWAAGPVLQALAWRTMLSGLGVGKSWRELAGMIGATQLAKYVPGNVAQYIGRAGIALKRGIPAGAIATTIALETLLLVIAAMVIGVGAGILSDVGLVVMRHHRFQLMMVSTLVVLAIIGLLLFRWGAPKLLRQFAPGHKLALHKTSLPSQSTLVRAFALYCCIYGLLGVGFILLAHFVLPSATHDYWLLIAALALAWVVGFVTPGAPAGLGVREGLLLLILAPVYSTTSASILVIALRIATTVGDLLIFSLGMTLLASRRRPSPHARAG